MHTQHTHTHTHTHTHVHRRYCSNEKLFGQWAKVLKSLPSTTVQTGGNAPVIAKRFAMEGWQVLLGAKMDRKTTQKLHPLISVAGNATTTTTTATDRSRDDVHLLFEYDVGDVWGPLTAPRANRFIVHNDYSNMMLETLDSFIESLASFRPSLVVVSGLQMLDNFPLDVSIRTAKLQQLQRALSSLHPSTKVHFEMASITEERLLAEILEYVVPYADSLGMNEQELANLVSMLEFGNVTIVSDPYPRVARALDQIRSLHSMLEERKSPGRSNHRRLTRVHVHTLAFQAILVSRDSVWRNMNGAVAKASLTAHRYVCASNKISTDKARLIMDESFLGERTAGEPPYATGGLGTRVVLERGGGAVLRGSQPRLYGRETDGGRRGQRVGSRSRSSTVKKNSTVVNLF